MYGSGNFTKMLPSELIYCDILLINAVMVLDCIDGCTISAREVVSRSSGKYPPGMSGACPSEWSVVTLPLRYAAVRQLTCKEIPSPTLGRRWQFYKMATIEHRVSMSLDQAGKDLQVLCRFQDEQLRKVFRHGDSGIGNRI